MFSLFNFYFVEVNANTWDCMRLNNSFRVYSATLPLTPLSLSSGFFGVVAGVTFFETIDDPGLLST